MQQEDGKNLSKSEVAIVAGLGVGIVVLIIVGIVLMVTRGSERGDSAIFGQIFSDDIAYGEKFADDEPIVHDYDDDDEKEDEKKDDEVVTNKYVFRDGVEAFEGNEEIFSDSCELKVENEGFVMGGEDMEALRSLTASYQRIEGIYELKLLDYEDRGNSQYLYVKKGTSSDYPDYFRLSKAVEDVFIPSLSGNLLDGSDALYKLGSNGEILINTESSRMLSATAFIYEVESGKGMNVVKYDGEHAMIVKPRDYLVNSKLPATDDNKTRVWSAFEAKKEAGEWQISRSYRYCATAP